MTVVVVVYCSTGDSQPRAEGSRVQLQQQRGSLRRPVHWHLRSRVRMHRCIVRSTFSPSSSSSPPHVHPSLTAALLLPPRTDWLMFTLHKTLNKPHLTNDGLDSFEYRTDVTTAASCCPENCSKSRWALRKNTIIVTNQYFDRIIVWFCCSSLFICSHWSETGWALKTRWADSSKAKPSWIITMLF